MFETFSLSKTLASQISEGFFINEMKCSKGYLNVISRGSSNSHENRNSKKLFKWEFFMIMERLKIVMSSHEIHKRWIMFNFYCKCFSGWYHGKKYRNFAIRPKLFGNCAFPKNFHITRLGEITVFYAVYLNTEKNSMAII